MEAGVTFSRFARSVMGGAVRVGARYVDHVIAAESAKASQHVTGKKGSQVTNVKRVIGVRPSAADKESFIHQSILRFC